MTILLATCEVTLETSRRDAIPLDPALVADLERLIEGARTQLGMIVDEKPTTP